MILEDLTESRHERTSKYGHDQDPHDAVEPRNEPDFGYRLSRAAYPAFRLLFPNQVIRAYDLARAMVELVVEGNGDGRDQVLQNPEINAVAEPCK